MFKPSFRTKRDGVPILSRKEIETIAEGYIDDFQRSALYNPETIDIDSFIECYLGMTPDYQYLSHNGIYLGMTVFNDTDKVPVYNPSTNEADYISARARTVIIDRRLVEDQRQEHRCRFTQAHEGGHDVFHTPVFYRDPRQLCFLEEDRSPVIQCRVDAGRNPRKTDPRLWTDKERMEWQANAFASCLMMPRPATRKIFEGNACSNRSMQIVATIGQMVDIFNMSQEAVVYRLKDLGLIQDTEVANYLPNSPFLDFCDLI